MLSTETSLDLNFKEKFLWKAKKQIKCFVEQISDKLYQINEISKATVTIRQNIYIKMVCKMYRTWRIDDEYKRMLCVYWSKLAGGV